MDRSKEGIVIDKTCSGRLALVIVMSTILRKATRAVVDMNVCQSVEKRHR